MSLEYKERRGDKEAEDQIKEQSQQRRPPY